MTNPKEPSVRITPLGDTAALAEVSGACRERITAALAACDAAPHPAVTEVVAGFESIAAHFDGRSTSYAEVSTWLSDRLGEQRAADRTSPRCVEIPVCYDGEDLAAVAERARIGVEDVIELHRGADYRVRVVGFAPGFPYLEGLPRDLHTPRRATPRTRVPAGSVAIGGPYTGLYPSESPGGWNLIGRTPVSLFDSRSESPALLQPGDQVRFKPVDCLAERPTDAGDARPRIAEGGVIARVVQPGVQTTMQDLGRPGWQRLGVSPSGAMDRRSLRLANWLVDNDDNAAVIEATLVGPVLEFRDAATVAITGATVSDLPNGRPLVLRSGDTLDLRRITGGARCYLSVAGGWLAPPTLGSASTDTHGKVGGPTLASGDVLGRASHDTHVSAAKDWALAPESTAANRPIRVLLGPQTVRFGDRSLKTFLTEPFRVSPQSNRTGVRLIGPRIETADRSELPSRPVVFGAIQVPADGQPIVLGADRQTLGGYPVIACVATVDLPRVGQLAPGDEVRFTEIDLAAAERLRDDDDRRLRVLREGIRLRG